MKQREKSARRAEDAFSSLMHFLFCLYLLLLVFAQTGVSSIFRS